MILSKEDIIGILKQFGSEFTDKKIERAMEMVNDKNDIFSIKKYIDDHRDRLEDARKAIEAITAITKSKQNMVQTVESKEVDDEDNESESKFPVHVFVRMRPLIQSEID